MKKIRYYAGRLGEKMGIPPDYSLDMPKIMLYGNRDAIIENHKGIIECTQERIRIKTKYGIICFEGRSLILNMIDENTISVSGSIYQMSSESAGGRNEQV